MQQNTLQIFTDHLRYGRFKNQFKRDKKTYQMDYKIPMRPIEIGLDIKKAQIWLW